MQIGKTTLERAFELARSGECANVDDLVRRIGQEGYHQSQISGAQLKKQLQSLIASAPKLGPPLPK